MKIEKKEQIVELSKMISNDFSLINSNLIPASERINDTSELKDYLRKEIGILIDKKYDLLLSALYRIDIDDKKIEELFAGKNREYIPDKLADLIIERQLQKLKFRQLHKEGKI